MLPGSTSAGTQNHIHAPSIGQAIAAATPKKPPKNKVSEVLPLRLRASIRLAMLLPAIKSHIRPNKANKTQGVQNVISLPHCLTPLILFYERGSFTMTRHPFSVAHRVGFEPGNTTSRTQVPNTQGQELVRLFLKW